MLDALPVFVEYRVVGHQPQRLGQCLCNQHAIERIVVQHRQCLDRRRVFRPLSGY